MTDGALPSFEPVWPETTIFWGAGATASLGLHPTEDQGKFFHGLRNRDGKPARSCKHVVEACAKLDGRVAENLYDLLDVLGFDGNTKLTKLTGSQRDILANRCSALVDEDATEFIANLRADYDLDALLRVIAVLPASDSGAQFLMDLFNVLDMHLESGLSFNVSALGGESTLDRGIKPSDLETLSQVRLRGARNCLVLLIAILLQGAYLGIKESKPEIFDQYRFFCATLAKLMQEEGIRFLGQEDKRMVTRAGYLFSYAIISMNFDPLLLWWIFNAHKDANDGSPPVVGSPCVPLKLYNDFGHFMAAREPGKRDLEPWYPYNEAAARRVNNPNHPRGRAVRLGKFYFPHGCFCWRGCPNCGKLNLHLADNWDPLDPSLMPPVPLQTECVGKARSTLEKEKREKGECDVVQCGHCGAPTSSHHTPVIMQTNFKGRHPSFIEEISRDMRACIERTRHVVLLGYSLPKDDVIYRALLASRQGAGREKYCSVVIGRDGPAEWLSGGELDKYLEDPNGEAVETVKQARAIFGNDRVRLYAAGIPRVFSHLNGNYKQSVKALLYPTNCGIDCFTPEGVVRGT